MNRNHYYLRISFYRMVMKRLYIPFSTTTSSHRIIVKSISSLSRINKHNFHLSAVPRFQTTVIASHISASKSVTLLTGTNSIRSSPAIVILKQVKDFILLPPVHHRHLGDRTSINIVAIFPCVLHYNKILMYIINSYLTYLIILISQF